MRLVTFYRCALLLPLVAPMLFVPFGVKAALAVWMLSLGFGGAQYLVFAVAMFVIVGRVQPDDRIWQLALAAPVLFAPVALAGSVAYGYIERLSNPELVGIWDVTLPMLFYTLVFGYAYVGLGVTVYLVAKKCGWVHASVGL